MSLPIISINETDREKIEISRDIGKSCERFGFFIIKDHNLKISTIENAKNLSKQFFGLSLKNKMNILAWYPLPAPPAAPPSTPRIFQTHILIACL